MSEASDLTDAELVASRPHPSDAHGGDEIDQLRARLAECERQRDAAIAERDTARAALARCQEAVLRGPITDAEVVEALAEGRAERRIAEGDNAWATIIRQRDTARAELAAMTTERDEAKRIGLSVCRIAHDLVTVAGTGEYGRIQEARARLSGVDDVRDLATLLADSETRARNSEAAFAAAEQATVERIAAWVARVWPHGDEAADMIRDGAWKAGSDDE